MTATRSWWDGRSRAPLRVGLAVAAALDLISLAGHLQTSSGRGGALPLAPGWLIAVGTHAAAIWIVAALGAGALVCFALGRAPLRSAALALLALGLLAESDAVLMGGPRRHVFAVGAVLLGWSIGVAWGRGLGGPEREDLAEAGALATLAATYFAAALSKLTARGLDWTDDLTLRDLLLSQRRVSDHGLFASLAATIVAHPGICRAMAVAALVVQLAAVLMLISRSLRVLVGGLLFAFHFQVWLLTGILYMGNLRLFALLCVPWTRLPLLADLLVGLPAPGSPPLPDTVVQRRVALGALAITAAVVGAAWLVPSRG